MADAIKNYQVQYDLVANVKGAEGGIQALIDMVNVLEPKMVSLQKAMLQTVNTIRRLEQYKSYTFKPDIDFSLFKVRLKEMVTEVQTAAAQMQQSLYGALSGNVPTGVMKKAGQTGANRSSDQIRSSIADIKKQIKNRQYSIAGRNSTLLNTPLEADKIRLQNEISGFQKEIEAYQKALETQKAELKRVNEAERRAAKKAATTPAATTTAVSSGKATTPAVVPTAKNITPEILDKWHKYFGNAKSKQLTVNIRGNASGAGGALTVIAEIQSALKQLQATAQFTINPILNAEGFAAAQAELKSLAALTRSVVSPIGGVVGEEKIGKGGKGKKVGKTKALPIDLAGTLTSVKAAQEFTVPVIGEITKLMVKTEKAVPIKAQIMAEQITKSIQSLPHQTIPVELTPDIAKLREQLSKFKSLDIAAHLRLGWEKGAIGKNQQLKSIQENIPPIKLILDASEAIATLENFVARIREHSPQNIALTATGIAESSTVATAAPVGAAGVVAAPTEASRSAARSKGKKAMSKLQRRYNSQYAKMSNAFLPFAENTSQLNTMMKYHTYFNRAARGLDIASMGPAERIAYLNNVSSLIGKGGKAIPMAIPQMVRKLEKQMASEALRGSIPTRGPVKPNDAYTRFRKAMYRYSGNTSFGAQTPMAVEMAKGMGIMFAIGGAMSAIGNSFSQATEYQNIMRTTNAILKNGTDSYTDSGFTNMERTVRNVGVKTKFTAPQVADAARFLAMAGYDINAINNSIRPIADIALIGDTDLGETADKMTNVMTTFKIAPERMREAANIMTTTFTRTNTTLMMLAESAKYAGGIAQLYGGNYENNFADVMAMFGVMGNAGIQASAAGTTLRMMYQNLMQPNKKQRAVLEEYGIQTRNANGSPVEMIDILTQLSRVNPENLSDVVGKLFRITAQPGAAALLNDITGGDETLKAQTLTANEWLVSKLGGSSGSKLLDLMRANRVAGGTTISNDIAEEKQMTIQGLWAQVTSTFTEGIVKAFENKEMFFTDILGDLRDYLAKPETVKMLQDILDLVIELAHVIERVVSLWTGLYELMPGVFKAWMYAQMFFKQFGMLISPITSMLGVFNSIKSAIKAISGLSIFSGGATGASVAAGAGGAGTGSLVGRMVGSVGGLLGGASTAATLATIGGGLAAVGAAIWGIYESWSDYTENVKNLTKSLADIQKQQQETRKKMIEYDIEIGNLPVAKVSYQRPDISAQTFDLSKNAIAQRILKANSFFTFSTYKDFEPYFDAYRNLLPEETMRAYANFKRQNQQDQYGFLGKKNLAKAQQLGVIAQWAQMATMQDNVQQAAKDIKSALYNKNTAEARRILRFFMPDYNAPRMFNLDDKGAVAELTTPQYYYEWQAAQYRMLSELFGEDSPLARYTSALEAIVADQEKKQTPAYETVSKLMSGVAIQYNQRMGTLKFLPNGLVNWQAFSRDFGIGRNTTLGERQEVLKNVYDTLANDPKVGQIDQIINIMKTYLPVLEKLQPVGAPGVVDSFGQFEWGKSTNKWNPTVPQRWKKTPPSGDPIQETFQRIQQMRRSDLEAMYGPQLVAEAIGMPQLSLDYYLAHNKNEPKYAAMQAIKEQMAAPVSSSERKRLGESSNMFSNNTVTPPTPPGPSNNIGNGNHAAGDQNTYASHYDRGTARATQVIINIDKLAQFDKTMVASGAEERDMVAAMENKITEAVLQLFSVASNNANNVMNLA